MELVLPQLGLLEKALAAAQHPGRRQRKAGGPPADPHRDGGKADEQDGQACMVSHSTARASPAGGGTSDGTALWGQRCLGGDLAQRGCRPGVQRCRWQKKKKSQS
ncbi:unnamed protein product [Prorocentrum cordatum]|uniref:Uncharacterized protein n=1 Tax=Prorocentrum cordatum TaxID=2364126 RepID=A0ABN9PX03_9DINO|nr:unnamed protein product [Polarella glacialis]